MRYERSGTQALGQTQCSVTVDWRTRRSGTLKARDRVRPCTSVRYGLAFFEGTDTPSASALAGIHRTPALYGLSLPTNLTVRLSLQGRIRPFLIYAKTSCKLDVSWLICKDIGEKMRLSLQFIHYMDKMQG